MIYSVDSVSSHALQQKSRRFSSRSRSLPIFQFRHAKSVRACLCRSPLHIAELRIRARSRRSELGRPGARTNSVSGETAMDYAEKDFAGNGNDGERIPVNWQDLEQSCRDQEPGADHVSRGLAIGHFVRELMVEGVASFLLVFWSAVAALMQEMHGTLTFPTVCLVVALTVAFVLCWLGPAHFNPAVTVTFAVFRYLSWTKLPFYVAAQLAGSVLACLSVNGVMEPRGEHFYGTVPMAGHTRLPFLLELLGSAVLMVVIATAARGSNQTVGGLAIGAAVGTLGLIIGPVSGGSMNPIRTLGPAIVLGRYTSVWIYLVAPVAGMLLGALCNRVVTCSDAILAFLCGSRAVAPKTGSRRVPAPRAAGAAVASQRY